MREYFIKAQSYEPPKYEIDDYLKSIIISFTMIDHYIDLLNYKNPLSQFLFTVQNGVNLDSFTTNNLNFYPGFGKSYDHLFAEKTTEKTAYAFHQNQQIKKALEKKQYLDSFFIWRLIIQQYLKALSQIN